jgi:hypothetical protein
LPNCCTLHQVQYRCEQLFELQEPAGGGPPVEDAAARASLPHPEWIPESVWAYARQMNGFSVMWQAAATDAVESEASGAIWLLAIESIFRDWEPEIGPWAGPRMKAFKPVDMHNDYQMVGLFHDEAQDPGLYIYYFRDWHEPYPLYLDMPGYIALLKYSLGYQYWQNVALELLPDDGRNPAHQIESVTPAFRRDLEALDPGFDYDAFVALYHEVKLKDYTPSGL